MIRDKQSKLAHELFQSYFRGWRDGASCHSMDKKFIDHPTRPDLKAEYEKGYMDGGNARKKDMAEASERLGYEPCILRACNTKMEV